MAAGKDEAQPVVFDAVVVPSLGIIRVGRESPVDIVRQRLESGVPANCVDGLETPGRYEPGARIGGHAIARPLLQSCPESIVQRLLGDIEVGLRSIACSSYLGPAWGQRVRAANRFRIFHQSDRALDMIFAQSVPKSMRESKLAAR